MTEQHSEVMMKIYGFLFRVHKVFVVFTKKWCLQITDLDLLKS